MRAFVTVRRYLDSTEAELARAHLEVHGIEARVSEPTPFNPLLALPAGGVRLDVPSLQVEQAERLLQELRSAHIDLDEAEADDADTANGASAAPTVRCPRCELEYCFFERGLPRRLGFAAAPIGALLALPFLLFGPKRWVCHKCEHVWSDPAEGPKKPTRLEPGDPEPVFRLHRAPTMRGLLLGFVAGFLLWVGVAHEYSGLLPMLFPIAGYGIGKALGADVCSGPKCREPLPPGMETCSACKGAVVGRVASAAEHYAAAADVRRELSACRAEEPVETPRKPKRRAKAMAA
ncbi:DUF2007 domain-containing protein [Chondromyces crocatus]|uniref:DUF2007 domain-containing protein n=1 Tax=Chondromyces crocatus TaxID=52 RepID=A0A0K1ERW4_CHOCO|nr:DUF2007 domain-containing protein [Chondromyces crocatus]AKT43660.1 uncharacterized protein CMC5_078950 [Chondromyces crocatus]